MVSDDVKYGGALVNFDCTASSFRYLLASLLVQYFRLGLLSECSSMKSQSLECNEHIVEFLEGLKSFRGLARFP